MQRTALRGFRARAERLLAAAVRSTSLVGRLPATATAAAAASHNHTESLEPRQLLSSVSLTSGVLNVVGNTSGDNVLTVDYRNNNKDIIAIIGALSKTYSASSISSINIVGGSGVDRVYVNPAITKATKITGNAGNDSIRGGGGNDSILGGDGNDTLLGWGGNDSIYGGNGNDKIDGGDGADTVKGEAGTNNVEGGAGADVIQVNSNSPVTGLGTTNPTTPSTPSTPSTTGSPSITFVNGVFTLTAGSGQTSITVDIVDDGGTSIIGRVNNITKTIARSALKSIVINGTNGKDYFYIHPTIIVPTTITGFGGGDEYRGRATAGIDTTPAPTTPSTGATSSGWVTVTKSNSDAKAPQLVVKLFGQKIYAGQQVQANAVSSTIPTGSALTAKYEWDFGDASGKYNVLRGWNAGHAYEKAGTYTVKLTVTDEGGRTTTLTTTVTVAADTRRTIYVSAAGNDANNGLSEAQAVKTITRANALMSDDVKVLFRRGDTFKTNVELNVSKKNILVGAYGSGNRPVLYHIAGGVNGVVAVYQNAVNTVVRDIVFDSEFLPNGNVASAIPTKAIYAAGTNMSVRNCEFRNVNYAVDAYRAPSGLLVQDNAAPLMTGVRGYLVWGEGSDHVYLGNSMVNSTREHVFRAYNVTRILIAYNDVRNADRSADDALDYSKGVIELQTGSWAYVFNNKVQDGPIRVGPRGGDMEAATTANDWVVIERNTLTNTPVSVMPGAHNVFIRNNVVTESDGDSSIKVVARDSDGRVVRDVWIVNNTGYNPSQQGSFIRVDGQAERITMMNNLFVMPKMFVGDGTGSVYIADDDLAGFKNISYNVWQAPQKTILWADGGVNWVKTLWGDAVGYKTPTEWDAYGQVNNDTFSNTSISGWTPSTSSKAANYAVKIAGVFEDYYGNARPVSGNMTAGAVEV